MDTRYKCHIHNRIHIYNFTTNLIFFNDLNNLTRLFVVNCGFCLHGNFYFILFINKFAPLYLFFFILIHKRLSGVSRWRKEINLYLLFNLKYLNDNIIRRSLTLVEKPVKEFNSN